MSWSASTRPVFPPDWIQLVRGPLFIFSPSDIIMAYESAACVAGPWWELNPAGGVQPRHILEIHSQFVWKG